MCFAKQKEKGWQNFCYPFIVSKTPIEKLKERSCFVIWLNPNRSVLSRAILSIRSFLKNADTRKNRYTPIRARGARTLKSSVCVGR